MTTTHDDRTELKVYDPPLTAPEAVLVSLENTLRLQDPRDRARPYQRTDVVDDLVNEPVLRTVYALAAHTRCKVIFLSGCGEDSRFAAEEWLSEHYALQYEALHMRQYDDARPDWLAKYDLFDAHVRRRYRVFAVIDGQPRDIRMWRSIGLPVFQVRGSRPVAARESIL